MVIQAEGVIAELTFHPVMILSSCNVTKSLRLDVSQCVLTWIKFSISFAFRTFLVMHVSVLTDTFLLYSISQLSRKSSACSTDVQICFASSFDICLFLLFQMHHNTTVIVLYILFSKLMIFIKITVIITIPEKEYLTLWFGQKMQLRLRWKNSVQSYKICGSLLLSRGLPHQVKVFMNVHSLWWKIFEVYNQCTHGTSTSVILNSLVRF
jgi:hypothetical protein